MKMNNYFPDIWGAVLILGGLLILQILIAFILYDLGFEFERGDPKSAIISVLAYGILFSVFIHVTDRKYSELFHISENSIASTVAMSLIPILIVIFGASWWLGDLEYYIASLSPPDPLAHEMLINFMSGGGITILDICLLAPIFEELLFRGIILRGFLSHYSPMVAIIASSALFSLIHFNMYQIPGAFVLGCFLAWLFYVSRSLWPCIIAHSLNNLSAYISYMQNSESYLFAAELQYSSIVVNMFTFMISALGLYLIHSLFRTRASGVDSQL